MKFMCSPSGSFILFQLAFHFAEPLAAILFLLFCHCYTTFPNLLGFGMNGVLFAEAAILVQLKLVRGILLVLHRIVVSLLALVTSQSDLHAHNGTSLLWQLPVLRDCRLPPCS